MDTFKEKSDKIDDKWSQTVWLDNTSKDLWNTLNENLLYQKKPLNETDIDNLENSLEQINIKQKLQKKAKTFMRIVREIAQNTFDHSLKIEPTILIKENPKEKCFSIETSNYFDWWKTNKEKLIETFEKINKSDAKTIKEAYMNALDNWDTKDWNWFSWAWLWLLDIARKIKKMISWKIFNYKIKEEKDKDNHTIYKLDLKTKFPMPDIWMAA